MEYEPHFIGEETKAAEGNGEQARLDSKAELPNSDQSVDTAALLAMPQRPQENKWH